MENVKIQYYCFHNYMHECVVDKHYANVITL
jgi:hypothetical protein